MLTVEVAFSGTAEQKRVASAAFDVMRAHGRFMAIDMPIRVSLESLVGFLNRDGSSMVEEKVEAALAANPDVFAIEHLEEQTLITTTRTGRAPRDRFVDLDHTFSKRFLTPLPKPVQPAQPARVRPRVDPSWATFDPSKAASDEFEDLDIAAAAAAELERLMPEVQQIIVHEPETAPAIDLVEPIDVIEPVEPAATTRVFRGAPVVPTRFNEVDDVSLATAIAERLRLDPRVANFGDQWMLEERVPRFSRGDLRRLREYIQEQEQPLTDDMLVQDVLGTRPGSADFELVRFAVNYRLSKEHREFDFVGTPNQRFWSTSNLPQIGTTRRKPNEIGTDYRFLVDEVTDVTPRSVTTIDHVLTFYEHYLGLLPYGADMQALLPAPVLPNQKSAVLTFECPQTYTTYLVELRYPTPNRGGFVLGLDDFYSESLVPGAMITISRTDNDGHYLVKYSATAPQSARLLELEERRQRYVFRPTSYACGVIDEYLISEDRFPNLASEKPLDEKIRRRAESVVATTFERLGHKSDGPGFVANFDELMAAANIERPFSERYLRSILDNDETGAFARDPDGNDAYTYVPGSPS